MHRRIVFLLLTAAAFSAHAEALPDRLELRYALSHSSGVSLGTTTKVLTRVGDAYRLVSETEPVGLGKMLTDSRWREEGQFKVVEREVRPLYYVQNRLGKKPKERRVTFDWGKGLLTFADGHQVKLPAGAQDQGSFLFALMLQPPGGAGETQVHITNGDKIRTYSYVVAGRETLNTPIGRLDTLRIDRRMPGAAKDDTFSVWLATARHNVPVKVVKQENGKKSTLLIDSLNGI